MVSKKSQHKTLTKHRLTAFVDPDLVTRAKVRGALENLTISQIVEKALDAYAPKIDTNGNTHINLKFNTVPVIDAFVTK